MSLKSHPPADPPPVEFTSLEISGFGFRVQADGRTGLEAWRTIRKRHPRIAWLMATHLALVVGVAVVGVVALL